MTEINKYITDLNNMERKWVDRVVDPYCLAYIDAYKKYSITLKKQDEYNKMKAEFAVFALSLMGGSILTVMFRKSSLPFAIKESSIEVMFKANSEKLLNMAIKLESSETASFVIGSLVTRGIKGAEKTIQKGIESNLKKVSDKASTFEPSTPLEAKIQFTGYVRKMFIQAHDFAAYIRDDKSISDGIKEQIVSGLKKAPIFNPPLSVPETSRLDKAKDIELLFYMYLILQSDFLQTTHGVMNQGGGSTHSKNNGEITVLPSASDYPKEVTTSTHTGGHTFFFGIRTGGTIRRVTTGPAYKSQGKIIRKKIDELYKRKTKVNFFQSDTNVEIRYTGATMGHSEMLRAEYMIKKFVTENKMKI